MLNPLLRPYQLEAIFRSAEAIADGQSSGLLVMPTGCGKTFIACELLRLLRLPTLFIVHRDELIQQTIKTLGWCWPMARVGVIKAERNEWQNNDVTIASVQSLSRRRLETIPKDRYAIVVADECQHIRAETWERAIDYFDKAFLLGLTATPDRLDGKGLAKWFGPEPIFTYNLRQAIDDDYLVRIRQYAIHTDSDLDDVPMRAGDFAEGALASATNTPERNQAIVEAFHEHASDRRAVCFCVDVAHSYDLALAFSESGIRSVCVTGEMDLDERRDTIARFAAGKIQVVTNCQVLTEGWDDPDVDCVIMARPTKSRALYTQCLGRSLRLPLHNKSKLDALILDITDNCHRHSLITACSLLGVKDKNASGMDILGILEAEEKEEQLRQSAIQEQFRGPIVWRLESVCPWPDVPSLKGYVGRSPWQQEPATEKQEKMVRSFGLEIQKELTKGEASHLIDKCLAYDAMYPAPATAKQQWLLRYLGGWEEGLTKKEASRRIGKLKGETCPVIQADI